MARVLFVETFYGGSHRSFADGLTRHSAHQLELVTLPAERWRDRIRLGAFEILRRIPDPTRYEAIVATDLINLADLRAGWSVGRRSSPPMMLYMHETQMTYPPPRTPRQKKMRDAATDLQDIKNCLVADRVLFNSHAHRYSFLDAVETLAVSGTYRTTLSCLDPAGIIAERSAVVYPGVSLSENDPSPRRDGGPPRILWNHRREYDKRPRRFFAALRDLAREGLAFEVVVLGENPREDGPAVNALRAELGPRVIQWGHVGTSGEYQRWLESSDIVVSTAIQENFGMAVVEAVAAGCVPLLPRRLSYPELIPPDLHDVVLYGEDRLFKDQLRTMIEELSRYRVRCKDLPRAMRRFSWREIVLEYDREISALVECGTTRA
jgi:glycosyltransferase involved in cell wall biosynthesis